MRFPLRLLATLLPLVAPLGFASGGPITSYTMALADGHSPVVGTGFVTDSSSDLFVFPSNPQLYYSYTSTASADPIASQLLKLAVTSINNGAGLLISSAAAGYSDIVTAKSSANQPAVLRFEFGVSGVMRASKDLNAGFVQATVRHTDYAQFGNLEGYIFQDTFGRLGNATFTNDVRDARVGHIYTTAIDDTWDTAAFTLVPGDPDARAFAGTYHIDAPFDPSTGGYSFSTILEVSALSSGIQFKDDYAEGSSDFSHTGTLLSVGLPDGTVFDPNDFTFASGLQFGSAAPAAPVPPTAILAGLGGLTLLGYRRRFRTPT